MLYLVLTNIEPSNDINKLKLYWLLKNKYLIKDTNVN